MRIAIFLMAVQLWLSGLATAQASTPLPEDQQSAVILAYHRIGEDAHPQTNLALEDFKAHLRELQSGGYNILPLGDVLTAFENHEKLPSRTVVITFEGAYRSAYEEAMPLLVEHKIPFTIFFASDTADGHTRQYMDWTSLKHIARHDFVSLGILPASYAHMAAYKAADIRRQINKARLRFREEFKREADLLSYPFGEYSTLFRQIAGENGFRAALGLHSGAAYEGADRLALPRFSMTEGYGDLARFRLVTHALPLPINALEPTDPLLTNTKEPLIGFSIVKTLAGQMSALSCFIGGQIPPRLQYPAQNRIEIRPTYPEGQERIRMNCTMPGPKDELSDETRWRWAGFLFTMAPNQ